MPSVAIRRERRKSKNRPLSASSGKHSSISSINSSHASSYQSRRTATQSINTISTLPSSENQLEIPYYRYCQESQEEEQQSLQLIVYAGAILVVVGLVLAFVRFGLNMPSTKNIGLLIIGLGSVLCFIRVFCTRKQTTLAKRPRFATTSSSGDPFYILAHTSSNTTPSNGSLRRLPLSLSQESTSTMISFRSTSLTPTSLNSIPETDTDY